ncbi:MAG: hypothetical protein AAF974_08135 [Cyanobacteria bacterium P01_E01_bin.34]
MARSIVGTWHITEMSMWDEEYFNMEVQAFVAVPASGLGTFQFGLVQGSTDGTFDTTEQNFHFSWEGCDEMDDCEGEGWIALDGEDENHIDHGELSLESGDSSTFRAKRAD